MNRGAREWRAMPAPPIAAAAQIETQRLLLRASDASMSRETLAFFTRNQAHFGRWDPPLPADFLSLRWQRHRLLQHQRAFNAGEGFRYWLFEKTAPARIVGQVHFSSIVRGAFHNAMLGYQLDVAMQGRGLMHEALQAGIAEMFSAQVNLHRLQAAHLPENLRSAAVLGRLGFEREGLARRYLFIAGQWRDHVINALLNDGFRDPPSLS
jgi:ribosomal-protein-alanine N-acetyltransferase